MIAGASQRMLNPQKTGIAEVMDIFWTINDPPGLQGLKGFHVGSLFVKKNMEASYKYSSFSFYIFFLYFATLSLR